MTIPTSGGGRSQHPADELIRELIRTGRRASAEEVERITSRMATAPFDSRTVPVRASLRGLVYENREVRDREDSLFYHLLQRTLVDGQWARGTTASGYLDDLRRSIAHPDARLALFLRRGGYMAATVTPTSAILSPARRGPDSLGYLLVVFSADRGTIMTGYQFSDLIRVSIPDEAKWLK